MKIRRLSHDDLEDCVGVFQQTFAAPPWSETWALTVVLSRIRQIMDTPGSLGVVLVDSESKICGFAIGVEEPFHEGTDFHLREICVAPALQRMGSGERLMAYLQTQLATCDTKRIYLLTARGDLSEAFYTKLGFYTSPRMIMMARRLEE